MWRFSLYHVRYLSHLALQVGSSNWVHKTQIHSFQRWCHFGTKTSQSAFLEEKQLHPLLYWIWYSWSESMHILYYINLSVRWNISLRNQILSYQYIFYYICPRFLLFVWILPISDSCFMEPSPNQTFQTSSWWFSSPIW